MSESPGRLPGAHDVPSAGSLPQRILRMAPARIVASSARELGPNRGDSGDSHTQRRDLRSPAHPRRVAGARTGREPEPGGAADARGPDRGSKPAPERQDDAAGLGGAARGRSGRAGLLGLGPRRTLGGRHHVRSHSGGLPLPRGGGGRLEPPGGGLVDGDALENLAGAERVRHGADAAAARRSDSPQRPGGANIRPTPSAAGAGRRGCGHPWARWAMHTTTRCARASSRRWSANSSGGDRLAHEARPAERSSSSSRDGTTRTGGIRASATSRRSASRPGRGGTPREHPPMPGTLRMLRVHGPVALSSAPPAAKRKLFTPRIWADHKNNHSQPSTKTG